MIIEYALFIGAGLYLIASAMFFFLFVRTLMTQDGLGLVFLRVLTISISVGSFTVFLVRVLSENGMISFPLARAIAVINPLILVGIALYLNFLFYHSSKGKLK